MRLKKLPCDQEVQREQSQLKLYVWFVFCYSFNVVRCYVPFSIHLPRWNRRSKWSWLLFQFQDWHFAIERSEEGNQLVCSVGRAKKTPSYLFFQKFTLNVLGNVKVSSGFAGVSHFGFLKLSRLIKQILWNLKSTLSISRKTRVCSTPFLYCYFFKFPNPMEHLSRNWDTLSWTLTLYIKIYKIFGVIFCAWKMLSNNCLLMHTSFYYRKKLSS